MDRDLQKLLLVGGGVALAIYLLTRSLKATASSVSQADVDESGTRRGGVLAGVGEMLVGQDQFSETVSQVDLPAGSGAVRPSAPRDADDPLDFITGRIVDPPNGGRVDRALFSSTVRWTAEIANAGNTAWTGSLRFEVFEDYLLKDNTGGYARVITVPPRSSTQLKVDYSLVGGTHLREPDLTIRMFAGDKLLASHQLEVT